MKLISHIQEKHAGIEEYFKIMWASKFSHRSLNTLNKRVNFNRILDDEARAEYKSTIEQMFIYVPLMMNRKISEANVQQAFVLDTVYKYATACTSPKILCVGSYEDTAATCLKMLGFKLTEIDPSQNYDLEGYYNLSSTEKESFDIIFSTSVIEHVERDDDFIIQIADLLAPGGIAILTCDFNDTYTVGDKLPQTDIRFYTKSDFFERLLPLIPNCFLVDEPNWDCQSPDFIYDGCSYTFATMVFRKENN